MITTFFLYLFMLLPIQLEENSEQLLPNKYEQIAPTASTAALISVNNADDKEHIIEAVTPYIDNMLPDDTLIEWEEDLWIKKSNLFGVEFEGNTYYYSLFPHMSFDPVSRGEVNESEVDIIVEETGYIIYTIN